MSSPGYSFYCHPGARPSLYHPVAINVCHPVRFFFLSSWGLTPGSRSYKPVAKATLIFIQLSTVILGAGCCLKISLSSCGDKCLSSCEILFLVILGLDPRIQVIKSRATRGQIITTYLIHHTNHAMSDYIFLLNLFSNYASNSSDAFHV